MKKPNRTGWLKRLAIRGAALGLCLVLLFLVTAWFGGCASPIEGLWPPKPGEKTFRILVSVDSWHTMIGLWPPDDPEGEKMEDIIEWGYAEKGYYMEGDTGSSGTMRAILVPSAGVVTMTRAGRPWSERTPQPPAGTWSFELTEAGYTNLKAHLVGEIEGKEPIRRTGYTKWYDAQSSYHLFHHCHHWAARALRSAGLPIWRFYAIFKWSFEAQLDRAQSFTAPSEPDR